MPSGPLYYLIIFLAASAVIGVKFGPQIAKFFIRARQRQNKPVATHTPIPVLAGQEQKYEPKELMNPKEKRLFKTLIEVLDRKRLQVFAKIRLDQLLSAPPSLTAFDQLILDFVVLDAAIMEPAFVIMLQPSAFDEVGNARLEAIKRLLAQISLPVVMMPAEQLYDSVTVRDQITQAFVAPADAFVLPGQPVAG